MRGRDRVGRERLRAEVRGSSSNLQDLGAQDRFSGLTQSPLTHVCPAHVLTDELGLSTKLLGVMGIPGLSQEREGRSN